MKLNTLKSKTFIAGLSNIITGGILIKTGNLEIGIGLISLGLIAIVGRDTAEKIIQALNK